jgi:RNA polymerase sigma factor (sigma-70 family)
MASSQLGRVISHLRGVARRRDEDGISDGRLLELYVRRRDEAAFEALVRRHGPMVLGVCRRILGNAIDADDAFQATFLVLVRKADSVRPRGMLGNWLYGVASRTAREARRLAARRRVKEREAATMPRAASGDSAPNELGAALDQGLSGLPDKYRAVLVLCDLEGKARREVAQELGLPEGTVASRLATARSMLAKRLSRAGLVLSACAWEAVKAQNAADAAVPKCLLDSTLEAARAFAAGEAVAGVIAPQALRVTRGVLKAMLVTRRKIATVLAIAAAVLAGTGAGLNRPPTPAVGPAAAGDESATRERDVRPRLLRVEKEDAWITCLAWGPDGKTLAGVTVDAAGTPETGLSINGSAVRVWDVPSGGVRRTLADGELKTPLWCLAAFSPDGKMLASKSDRLTLDGSGALVLWEAETGKVTHRLKYAFVLHTAFSPDGATLAVAGADAEDNKTITLWDVRRGRPLRTIDKAASEVVFSPGGSCVAAVVGDGKQTEIVLWDATSGTRLRALPDSDGFQHVAFLPGGKSVLAFAPKKAQLTVWDVTTGKTARRGALPAGFAKEPAPVFAAAPDGQTVALGGRQGDGDLVILFDVPTGKQTRALKGPGGRINCLAFSGDGRNLACGTQNKMLCVWEFGGKSR